MKISVSKFILHAFKTIHPSSISLCIDGCVVICHLYIPILTFKWNWNEQKVLHFYAFLDWTISFLSKKRRSRITFFFSSPDPRPADKNPHFRSIGRQALPFLHASCNLACCPQCTSDTAASSEKSRENTWYLLHLIDARIEQQKAAAYFLKQENFLEYDFTLSCIIIEREAWLSDFHIPNAARLHALLKKRYPSESVRCQIWMVAGYKCSSMILYLTTK